MRDTKSRKTYIGTVVSNTADKTISVKVDTYRSHKLYGKRVKYSKKFAAHDEQNKAKVGDTVLIMATRPMSKTKSFRLVEIKEKAKG
ncbi:MAG: 30S ribosomal protein S17 [Candidatus Tyloplasma litorale]|nr:MAG: 30S ribosomal protein S17 [Mycoplasmatales bacterium]